MSIYRELSYNQDIHVVKGIQFSVLGPEEITRRSAVEVTKTDTFNGSDPVVGGLFDLRMGVLEHNRICATCEQKNIFCPGHFGHIVLTRPVFHPMFFDTVRKLLKCVCHRCSRPMASLASTREEFVSEVRRIQQIKSLQKRWDAMVKLCNNTRLKRCGDDDEDDGAENGGCRARQPWRYNKDVGMKIVVDWRDGETPNRELTAEDVLRIFRRISDKDMELFGFHSRWNRPEWMICSVLPVPPPSVRPSVIEENGQRREDDLTHKLSDIIKYNQQLRHKLETGKVTEESARVLINLIQYHVATFMDNQLPGMPVAQQRNGRKLKSVADRLKKKEGRIRGNLNGKRVDQSARSVITPDPYISIDELGVPIKIATTLTFPEEVNDFNIDEMRALVRRGPENWPGAKYVRLSRDGITKSLKYADCEQIAQGLVPGDIVDRHMRNGDYVLFNRQPSLHKMSMMCHRVVIMPHQTFRLNPTVCKPYNADFDGDEMNVFHAQNVQTMGEIMDLAAVPLMVITPRDGKPVMDVVQDTMLGSFRLTKDWTRINELQMANLQMVNSFFSGTMPAPYDATLRNYTGKQAFAQILPPGLLINIHNSNGEAVRIRDGSISSGTLDKKAFTGISKGLIPVIYHDYGPSEVQRFLDNTQRLVIRWLLTAGFSVGISDLVTDHETSRQLKNEISKFKARAYTKIESVRRGQLDNNSIFNNEEYFEREILNVLNELTKVVGQVGMKHINDRSNRMINMVKSGAKGKETNVAQLVACVGQQNVDGKRVAYGFTGRTLPHYTKYDDGPEARGFVESSFISGLTPTEVFFHAMGGREGLIDTAVKTSHSGYLQRRLIKAMEDCKVYYDQTVRNATGSIVQFLYGEDGMDGTRVEKQILHHIDMSPAQLFDEFDLGTLPSDSRFEQHYADIMNDRMFLIKHIFAGQRNDCVTYPIPFERILQQAAAMSCEAGCSDVTPTQALDAIDCLLQQLRVMRPGQGMHIMHILVRLNFSPSPIIRRYRLQKHAFDWAVAQVETCFKRSIAQAGEMVGIIAAQSLGEFCTQLTLNSFHSSGTAAAVQATSGIPRLQELLSVSKHIKTPTMLIFMKPGMASVVNPVEDDDGNVCDQRMQDAKDRAMRMMHGLETTRLSDILESTDTFWDPIDESSYSTGVVEDQGFMAVYSELGEVHTRRSSSPWVLRMRLSRERMYRQGLCILDVHIRIFQAYHGQVECLFSDDNAPELQLQVRLTKEALKDVDPEDALAALNAMESNLRNVLLKGMNGVKKVSMHQLVEEEYDAQHGVFDKLVQWTLDTDGSNLMDILAHQNVDSTRTASNDIWEVFDVLGIEAARTALQREFACVLGKDAINHRHMSLLLDTITNRGTLMSVDRHGINRGDVGPLAKSSFEETTDMLIKASMFSEYDRINGLSANIMLGQLPPCGTGDHVVLLDEHKLRRLLADEHIPPFSCVDTMQTTHASD